jgi:hypothetical protein
MAAAPVSWPKPDWLGRNPRVMAGLVPATHDFNSANRCFPEEAQQPQALPLPPAEK